MEGRGRRSTQNKKRDLRAEVLKAAIDIVGEKGAGAMTLDAVAARAGVSKGGLLHHFKSKEALLTELIADVTRNFEAERRNAIEALSRQSNPSPEGEIEMMLMYMQRAFSGLGRGNQGAMALFAAAIHQPSLLQPVRDYFAERVLDVLEHSRSPRAVLSGYLLADGLWLFDALGIPPFTGKLREQVGALANEWMERAIRLELPKANSIKAVMRDAAAAEAAPKPARRQRKSAKD